MRALTRPVSPSLRHCELTHVDRTAIDIPTAMRQHAAYEQCLRTLGVTVESLPAAPDLPDAPFVEDTAVVLDEVALVTRMGAETRRAERNEVTAALARHREVVCMSGAGTLDGGDVIRVGTTLLVGQSSRTTEAGIEEMRQLVAPYGYRVTRVGVRGCLHLQTGCTHLGDGTLLVNSRWIDADALRAFDHLEVAPGEPWAANAIRCGDVVMVAGGFPKTSARLAARGFTLQEVDISEFQKAEAGLTCLSLRFGAPARKAGTKHDS